MVVHGKRRKPGARSCKVSIVSGIRMAVQKSLGHAAQTDMLAMFNYSIKRQTLCKWELILAKLIIFHSNVFFQEQYKYLNYVKLNTSGVELPERMADPSNDKWPHDRRCSWAIHSVRTDATNSAAVRHGAKAKALELDVFFNQLKHFYTNQVDQEQSEHNLPLPASNAHKIYSDIAVVPLTCKGIHCRTASPPRPVDRLHQTTAYTVCRLGLGGFVSVGVWGFDLVLLFRLGRFRRDPRPEQSLYPPMIPPHRIILSLTKACSVQDSVLCFRFSLTTRQKDLWGMLFLSRKSLYF